MAGAGGQGGVGGGGSGHGGAGGVGGGGGPGGGNAGDSGGGIMDDRALRNQLGITTPTTATAIDPIIQAALIQSQAIEQGIPFFEPFLEAGQQGLAGLRQGATVGGLDEILGQIFGSGSFQNLVGERQRGVQGQLAAGGLTRSGAGIEAAANVPTELGFMIEQLLSGRQAELAGGGERAAFNIADLIRGSAEATASGILGVEERRSGRRSDSRDQMNQMIMAGIAAFSDPRLKDNIELLGSIGANGLNVYKWDWKPEFENTLVERCPTIGFLSTEVKEVYPDLVAEYAGLDVVNYPELLGRL